LSPHEFKLGHISKIFGYFCADKILLFMRTTLFSLLLLGFYPLLFAQTPTPAPAQSGTILIYGATAHLGNGNSIASSVIAFDKGVITMVADASTVRIDRTKYSKILDATGQHVYPGFIGTNSRVGLVEIDAVRATTDVAETGGINPNARALIAFNTDSEVIPTLRTNGVLLAQVVPEGGTVSGTSAVVQLDAWNWEDANLREDGIVINWPALRSFGGFETGNPEMRKNEKYEAQVQDIHRYFAEAQAYSKQTTPKVVNLRFEAMRSLFDKRQNLYIRADNARSMQEAVLMAEQYGVRPVLIGGEEAPLMLDFLKTHNVALILREIQRLPARDDDAVAKPFELPAILHNAGIAFALGGQGGWRQRNLPFQAGQAIGFGLPYEAGVAALTSAPARILGIDNRYGTLENGKSATLFISEGDALDMRTCKVLAAFIDGRDINLDNRHKTLARKFGEKYKRQK
jgi:imidazolonepropionase-like amidohydrolase